MAERKRLFPDIKPFSRKHIFGTFALILAALITLIVILLPIDLSQLVKLGYVGIFLVNLLGSITVIFPTPAIMAAFVGGVFLNPIWAGLLAGLGSGLGEINGYLAGCGGRAVIEKKGFYERLRPWIAKNGFITIFVLAALPNPLFDLAGITAGAMGYPFLKFAAATILGKMAKGLALAFLGFESSKFLGPLLR